MPHRPPFDLRRRVRRHEHCAWGNRIHAHGRCEFERERFRQRDEAGFARAMRCISRPHLKRRPVGDVDDDAVSLLEHHAPDGLRQKERAFQIDVNRLVPFSLGDIQHGLAQPHGRAIDEHIYAPQFLARRLDKLFRSGECRAHPSRPRTRSRRVRECRAAYLATAHSANN